MRALTRALVAVELLALAAWMGGLATLGAVVAPLVFGIVPAPWSADAMTAVFRRFDVVCEACAVVVVAIEASLDFLRRPLTWLDGVRGACAVAAAWCGFVVATKVSPMIEALHRAGAVRGSGEDGLALDRAHHLAEALAKFELAALALLVVLVAFRPDPKLTVSSAEG